MVSPLVYAYESQLKPTDSQNATASVLIAPAIRIDEGEVFHLCCKHSPAHTRGQACTAFICFTDQLPKTCQQGLQQIKAIQKNHLDPCQSASNPTLFLFVRISEQQPECLAFIFSHPESLIECTLNIIPEQPDLYSRHSGLLETAVLQSASVGIIGVGSGGSSIAVELAKAGIGQFILIDPDRLEIGNISRHACGIGDLGRYKTKAVSDLLYAKNPYLEVGTIEQDINQYTAQFERILSRCDLLIGATDNNRSRFNINSIALQNQTPVIFGRALTRASGGDVLRVRPFAGPCLSCVFNHEFLSSYQEELSQFSQARNNIPAYVPDNEVEAGIQVGLSSDIMPIANMVTKLALLELSRDKPTSGITSVQEDLVADFYIWANRRELTYADWPMMGYGSRTPSILRWYGARYQRNPECPSCGRQNENDMETDDSTFFASGTLEQ